MPGQLGALSSQNGTGAISLRTITATPWFVRNAKIRANTSSQSVVPRSLSVEKEET